MLEPLIPTTEQQAGIDRMLSSDSQGAAAIGSDMGVGKTLQAVEFCKQSHAKTVLLIVPLQTIGNSWDGKGDHEGWHGTFERQIPGVKFRQIDSSAKGLEALADYSWGVEGVYAVTHQLYTLWAWEFAKDANGKVALDAKGKKKRARTSTWDFEPDVIVFDEAHRFSNAQSLTYKAMIGSGHTRAHGLKAGFKIAMSGTLAGNSFEGAWSVTHWLWPDVVDASISIWRSRWALTEFDPFAYDKVKVVGERDPGAFLNSLPCYIREEADFGIEIEAEDFLIELYPNQRKIYDDLEEKMVAWLKDNPLVVKFPIVKRARLRQASLGMPTVTQTWNPTTFEYDDDVTFDLDCESSTIDSMWAILEGAERGQFQEEPALIFTDSQKFAQVLVHRLDLRYGEGSAFEYSGKVSKKDRNEYKQAFLAGEFRYLVAVVKAGGTGVDLLQTIARNLLFVSTDDSRIENEQGIGRLVRRGQKSPIVRVARMIRKDTVDGGQRRKHIDDALSMNASLKKARTK